ncbi:MAG TPA: hypothetical protein VEH77_10410 [Roseiarcus sp.]|nr:hypothetical protein [Roseiarcus sp.]
MAALSMLAAIAGATITARSIEMRSVYEARLSDAEVARRFEARGGARWRGSNGSQPQTKTVEEEKESP